MTTTRSKVQALALCIRRLGYVLGSIAIGLALLWLFDLIIDDGATFWAGPVFRIWPILPATGLTAVLLYLASKRKSRVQAINKRAVLLRRVACAIGIFAAAPIFLLIVDDELYRPLKFSYLIWKVESAQTVEEEFHAFRLAERWGCVWELNRHWRQSYLPPRAQHLPGDWILELEWLECSSSGAPYCAYRRVLREENLTVFRK
jgi:hypothetical protein